MGHMYLSRDVSIEIQLRRGAVEMTGKENRKEMWTVRLDSRDGGSGIDSTQKAEQQLTGRKGEAGGRASHRS